MQQLMVRERRERRGVGAHCRRDNKTTRVYCLSGSGMGFVDVVVGR